MNIFSNHSDSQLLTDLYNQLYPRLKENHEATHFCVELMLIYQTWDDLIDKDKECTDSDINQTFLSLFFGLPTNPFYAQYQAELRPLIMSSILKWFDANKMEKEGKTKDLHMAYMLRADIFGIFCHVAFLVGGLDYAKTVGVQIRRIYDEKMSEFIKEVKNA